MQPKLIWGEFWQRQTIQEGGLPREPSCSATQLISLPVSIPIGMCISIYSFKQIISTPVSTRADTMSSLDSSFKAMSSRSRANSSTIRATLSSLAKSSSTSGSQRRRAMRPQHWKHQPKPTGSSGDGQAELAFASTGEESCMCYHQSTSKLPVGSFVM